MCLLNILNIRLRQGKRIHLSILQPTRGKCLSGLLPLTEVKKRVKFFMFNFYLFFLCLTSKRCMIFISGLAFQGS